MPLDRNAKARIAVYARAWSARNRQPRQHRGPITRAFLDVLEALVWGFHNSRSGVCFPSYESIATKAECSRSTVAEALKALEWAGVLTWQHRITRILVRERDLFGQWASRWRVIRTSNAYVFSDPKPQLAGVSACKSENPSGTQNQDILNLPLAPTPNPNSPLERALQRLSAGVEEVAAALTALASGSSSVMPSPFTAQTIPLLPFKSN
ncbi:MAG: helix-turn-helix domain-containing protein, partial [Acetobacteraceae bacterium]